MKQKKALAGKILKVSPYAVRFEASSLGEISKAITRGDMRGYIAVGKIYVKRRPFRSRAGARHIRRQKAKGRRSGTGTHKGGKYAIIARKAVWRQGIRVQRSFLQELRRKGLLSRPDYRMLYARCKGGFFRNRRHIKLYLTEHHLLKPRASNKPRESTITAGMPEGNQASHQQVSHQDPSHQPSVRGSSS